jgi:hypothetical protein
MEDILAGLSALLILSLIAQCFCVKDKMNIRHGMVVDGARSKDKDVGI